MLASMSGDLWEAREEQRALLFSPLPVSYAPLSHLPLSPLSAPHSSLSPSLVTQAASWSYECSPSSPAKADTTVDYQSVALASPSSSSVDCYLVNDVNDRDERRLSVTPINSFASVPTPVRAPPSSLPPRSADLFQPLFFVSPVPTDERVVRRKLKHKLLDSERRRRENAALQSLARLTAASNNSGAAIRASDDERQHEHDVLAKTAVAVRSSVERQPQHALKRRRGVSGSSSSSSQRVKNEDDGSGGTEQLAKVDVLERSVARLEEAMADNHKKDRRIVTLQHQLHAALAALAKRQPARPLSDAISTSTCPTSDAVDTCLSPSALSFVSAVDRSQCLSLRSFVRPHISLLSASLPHFRIVDVNSAHRKLTGWSDDVIIHKLMAWSLSQDERWRSDVAAIVKKVRQHDNGEMWVQKVTQYPASGEALRQLLRGNKEKVEVVWRMYKSDGRLYETECTFWLGGRVPVEAADDWDQDDDISRINSQPDDSDTSGKETAKTRLAGRYLIVAAAWQSATEVSS